MRDEHDPEKLALIEEIQRRIAYLLSSDAYSTSEKEAIARRFFQILEAQQ
jgi:hypothetical protein